MVTNSEPHQKVKLRHRIAAQGIRAFGWTRLPALIRSALAWWKQRYSRNVHGPVLAGYLEENGFERSTLERHMAAVLDVAFYANVYGVGYPAEVAETKTGRSFAFTIKDRKLMFWISKLSGQAMMGSYQQDAAGNWLEVVTEKARPREMQAAFMWLKG